jgi:ATP-dependent Zn protease
MKLKVLLQERLQMEKRFRANTSRIDDRAGELFDEYNVPYEYSKVKGTNTLAAMFINVLPLLLIIGVSMLIFRSMQGGRAGVVP